MSEHGKENNVHDAIIRQVTCTQSTMHAERWVLVAKTKKISQSLFFYVKSHLLNVVWIFGMLCASYGAFQPPEHALKNYAHQLTYSLYRVLASIWRHMIYDI